MVYPPQNQSICRTCLTKTERVLSVFNVLKTDNTMISLCDALLLCTSVQIAAGDGLPEQMCVICVDHLTQAYLFRKTCEKSDSVLRGEVNPAKALDLIKVEFPDLVCNQTEQGLEDPNLDGSKESGDTCHNDAVSLGEDAAFLVEKKSEDDNSSTIEKVTFDGNYQTESVKCLQVCISSDPIASDVSENNQHSKELEKPVQALQPFTRTRSKKVLKPDDLLRPHTPTRSSKRRFQCKVCCKDFARNFTLSLHMLRHTGGPGPHTCKTCSKICGSPSILKQHELTHTGEKLFLCSTCGKGFALKSQHVAHLSTHTGLKPYKCEDCGKAYTMAGTLRLHRRVHTGEKPYRCEVCGKQFRSAGELNSHRKMHSDNKPLECKVCGQRFVHSSNRTNHMRTHTGEKPYECKECGKRFGATNTLKAHVRTHTGERPFVCEICGRAFTQRPALATHKKLLHKTVQQRQN